RGEVAVEAVVGGVEGAVMEPADMDLPGEIDVLDLGRRLDPREALGLFAPEALGIVDRALIELEIAGLVDPSGLGSGFGYGKQVACVHGGTRPSQETWLMRI